jgi:hypothetical protein
LALWHATQFFWTNGRGAGGCAAKAVTTDRNKNTDRKSIESSIIEVSMAGQAVLQPGLGDYGVGLNVKVKAADAQAARKQAKAARKKVAPGFNAGNVGVYRFLAMRSKRICVVRT